MELTQNVVFDKCVYTIVNTDVIQNAENNDSEGHFVEGKSWAKAFELFKQAELEDKLFLLLLADAAHIRGVEWVAQIIGIDILPEGNTKISFAGLHFLEEIRPRSDLQLLSSGEAMSNSYIRPYALCITPDFVYDDTAKILVDVDDRDWVALYKAALLKIEPEINEGQRKMLLGHYGAPDMALSVKRLAEIAGYQGDRSGSLQYGKLARKISEAIGEPTQGDQISTIAEWRSDLKDERGHGQWILYDEVAQALEELGWVNPSATISLEEINANNEKVIESISETTYKAWVDQRIGQQQFRNQLIQYWCGCAVTGCPLQDVLIASHIVPWSIATQNERLDVYNGLLLTANLDKLFDAFLISFNSKGGIRISKSIDAKALLLLGVNTTMRLRKLEESHIIYLQRHESKFRILETRRGF